MAERGGFTSLGAGGGGGGGGWTLSRGWLW